MSLRILYHHRIRAEDGQAVHVREMIGALRRRGHEVRECALVQKTVARSETGKAKPSFWQKLRLPRAAVEALEIGYNGKARAMLQEAAAAWKPDIVYERHALHCRAGLDAARKLSVPLLLEAAAAPAAAPRSPAWPPTGIWPRAPSGTKPASSAAASSAMPAAPRTSSRSTSAAPRPTWRSSRASRSTRTK